ncbi:hypothetical protein niasHS_011060 [Heterodera schachtii]|uniref:RPAP1/MINIYO-like TPR repeats domain-containing protein n=1 Tax=Heterodera schachtii TaxID=97005 RepID=A0ABD2J3S3_HETSC
MATQLFRIGKPKNEHQTKEKVRFELDVVERGEDEQKTEDSDQPMRLGAVQERFVGFFELPERCVPFESTPFDEENSEKGFPAVIDLTEHAKLAAPSDPNDEPKTTEQKQKGKSLFARHFDQMAQREEKNEPKAKVAEGTVDQSIKNLELMPTRERRNGESAADWTQTDEYSSRYAIDPVHSDFTVKCLRHVVSRQEQQLVKLFDTLGSINSSHISSQLPTESVRILEEAKRSIELIRPLYLEQIQSEESRRVGWQFARRFVDPFSDGAWTLSPIRRVLDAVQQRNCAIATSDDVEIVRLALLWTVSLFLLRPAFFRSSVCVNEFFCRLAEIYLIGPEVFLYDDQIRNCVSILVNDFLIDARKRGPLSLRLRQPIAFLDQFMPFFEDLLQRYENFSAGDDNFALLLLIGTYLNSSRLDGLLMAQTLWSPKRDVVRQMILSEEKAGPFLPFGFANDFSVKSQGNGDDTREKALINEEIVKLMANYARALKEGAVVKERNGATRAIAIAEIKEFIGRNEANGDNAELLNGLRGTLSKIS